MGEKVLTIIEVSQKQAYIFASNKLQDNVTNSDTIAYILSPEYFEESVKKINENKSEEEKITFSTEDNLVYSGGGHTVLEFKDETAALKFNKFITHKIHEEYPDIALFVKNMKYDESKTPGENLKDLTKSLVEKKSIRKAAFHQGSFGVEKIDVNTLNPIRIDGGNAKEKTKASMEEIYPKDKFNLVTKFEELGGSKGDSNFIAVVHIDGNAMGKRVENLYGTNSDKAWNEFKDELQKFSNSEQKVGKKCYNRGRTQRIS